MRILALLMFFLFLFPEDAFALSLSFDSVPTGINQDQDFDVNVSFSCQSCKDSYLRAVFFKEGTHDYFGYTQNDKGDWVNTTGDKNLYYHLSPDSLVEGSWSGKLKAKADPTSTSFSGGGTYLFKVGRYTSASSSATWSSNTASINVTAPTPSPTPSPSPTLPPTTTPAHQTAAFPTTSRLLTITVTSSKTPTASSSPTQKWYPDVLGSTVSASPPDPSRPPTPSIPENQLNPMGTATFFGVAAATIGLLSLAFWRLGKLTRPDRLKL